MTLLELVIAIGIAAIIMASLTVIVRATVDVKITVESEARARRLGPTIMATITRDLRNAWVTGPDENVQIDGIWFRGEHKGGDNDAQDELWFVTSINSFMRYENVSSDLTEVGYYLKPNDVPDDSALAGLYTLYRREDFLVDKRPDEGGLGVKLHDRVISFRVWYYELPRDAVDAEGVLDPTALEEVVEKGSDTERDDWDTKEMNRLPYAIRVELILDATPIDAYNRNKKRRIAVYETLVRLPDFPKIDENFKLFGVQAPTTPAAPPANNGNNTGNNQNPPPSGN
jgi:type II secretory pathway component PulJ